ncbi:hypothetical protein ACFWA6_38540 [Streptomyces sp. NPDC060020]|uniref:hypothetical protein n=1 Tax=Streptomyces sp. NPDC060020 TaxID=3347038 RepID=UPI0036AB35A6
MRTTAIRAFTAFATTAAVVMMATAGASAATTPGTAGAAPAAAPAQAAGWTWLGEYPKAECYALRDSYAGKAKCERNAGGLYDLYVR